jgi:hypothetical protein
MKPLAERYYVRCPVNKTVLGKRMFREQCASLLSKGRIHARKATSVRGANCKRKLFY